MPGPRVFLLLLFLSVAGRTAAAQEARVVISVPDQLLALVEEGAASVYRISTSRFGLGDDWGSYKTPLGRFRVCEKLGDGLPLGAVLRHGAPTGEILRPNAPGRDPIVTRILWLEGLEPGNRQARERAIYIHGTPEEEHLGRPSSYGCVRMRSADVALLFERCGIGNEVLIGDAHLGALLRDQFGFRLATCPALPGFAARSPEPVTSESVFLARAGDLAPLPWLRLTLSPDPLWLSDTTALRYSALLQMRRLPRPEKLAAAVDTTAFPSLTSR